MANYPAPPLRAVFYRLLFYLNGNGGGSSMKKNNTDKQVPGRFVRGAARSGRIRYAAPLLVMALAAAACGGGGDGNGDAAPGETTTTTTAVSATGDAATTTAAAVATTTTTTRPVITTTTTTTRPAPELTSASPAALRSLGPVRIGMTVEEASEAAGLALTRSPARGVGDNCYYVNAGLTMNGVFFMVVNNQIARIEIEDPSPVATRSGVRVGTSSSEVRSTYPNNIQRANEAVAEGGEALAFVPNDDFDSEYRIYFEITDGSVARYRLGVKPAIDRINGCSDTA